MDFKSNEVKYDLLNFFNNVINILLKCYYNARVDYEFGDFDFGVY